MKCDCKLHEKTIAEARTKIQKAIDQDGPYTHNILGLVLSKVAKELDVEHANGLVEEFNLEDAYGICPVEVK